MTKNHPSLRKTVSHADLYADPSPPPQPREPGLSRTLTTLPSRPARRNEAGRPNGGNPYVRDVLIARSNPWSEVAPPRQRNADVRADIEQRTRRSTTLRDFHRHSIANPYDNLIDLDDVLEAPREQQSPPPVPPKIPEAPASPSMQAEPRREREGPEIYTKPFTDFMTANPTVFHAVDAVAKDLEKNGYKKLSERDTWNLEKGGKYYVDRNGSSLIAFALGKGYEVGNGAAIVAGHIDALTAKLKPIPKLRTKAGFVQLGVAPYAGALNNTWWDRDLGIGGRVLVKENGKIVTKLVKLDWPIARIPTLAPHFGAAAVGPFNKETNMVPIIGLDNSDIGAASSQEEFKPSILGGEGAFVATQPERLVRAICKELSIQDYSSIVNWELELFDVQPATVGGIDKEFIFAGRIDDKLCSWAAIQALLNTSISSSSQIKMVALFDDEEVGSLLRQGARGNFLPTVVERIVDEFAAKGVRSLVGRTYANSFLVSSDVIHSVNPNFLNAYLENHSPRLNVGPAISADSNAHMTTDAVSTAVLQRCVDTDIGVRKQDPKLQVFQIRNDSRSGGTVGPMLSAQTGIRAIDCGIPQLSMHSIRATTGSLDPGLGVFAFQSFLENFEKIDAEFKA
ncbi:aspartyl aminopeptidase [Corynespora cassiicola Philippines]|uniref:Aspartyl aminopeptidase n=1 Tax=Corynespora cassiicola Philippines TaxID=1448308 RepID=A0A2T2P9M9_CORCC|nr:aspartyl aminopeptidase [Corynespora cassiicola Philippines]